MIKVNLGFASSAAATAPSVTASALQGIQAYSVALEPERPAKTFAYIDGTTQEFGGGLIYNITLELSPVPFTFWNSAGTVAAGASTSYQLHLWWQGSPKFMQSSSSNWTTVFGADTGVTGGTWVKVTGDGKLTVDKQYGREYYKFSLKAAALATLS